MVNAFNFYNTTLNNERNIKNISFFENLSNTINNNFIIDLRIFEIKEYEINIIKKNLYEIISIFLKNNNNSIIDSIIYFVKNNNNEEDFGNYIWNLIYSFYIYKDQDIEIKIIYDLFENYNNTKSIQFIYQLKTNLINTQINKNIFCNLNEIKLDSDSIMYILNNIYSNNVINKVHLIEKCLIKETNQFSPEILFNNLVIDFINDYNYKLKHEKLIIKNNNLQNIKLTIKKENKNDLKYFNPLKPSNINKDIDLNKNKLLKIKNNLKEQIIYLNKKENKNNKNLNIISGLNDQIVEKYNFMVKESRKFYENFFDLYYQNKLDLKNKDKNNINEVDLEKIRQIINFEKIQNLNEIYNKERKI